MPSLDSIFQALRRHPDPRVRAYALSTALEQYRPGLSNVVYGATRAFIARGVPPDDALYTALDAAIAALAARHDRGLGTNGAVDPTVGIITGIGGMVNNALSLVSSIQGYQFESDIRSHQRYLERGAAAASHAQAETAAALAEEAARRAEVVEQARRALPGTQLLPTDSTLDFVRGGTLPTWAYVAIGGGALVALGAVGYFFLR
jgi:hypothetical protein